VSVCVHVCVYVSWCLSTSLSVDHCLPSSIQQPVICHPSLSVCLTYSALCHSAIEGEAAATHSRKATTTQDDSTVASAPQGESAAAEEEEAAQIDFFAEMEPTYTAPKTIVLEKLDVTSEPTAPASTSTASGTMFSADLEDEEVVSAFFTPICVA
jgi:hypothetical protein